MTERLTGKIEALRLACGLYQVVNPDPGKIIETAQQFEGYLYGGDTGEATPKKPRGRPPKSQAPAP